MQQYFVQTRLQLGQPLLLDAGQSHHILHVMRMKEGDVIALCDEQQMMLARISVHERSVQALPYELVDVCNDMPAEVTLIMSFPVSDASFCMIFSWFMKKLRSFVYISIWKNTGIGDMIGKEKSSFKGVEMSAALW